MEPFLKFLQFGHYDIFVTTINIVIQTLSKSEINNVFGGPITCI